MTTKKQAFISLSWVGALRGSTRGLSMLRTIVMARLLNPTQFGIFGVAALLLGFLEMLTETGINVVLVQDKSANSFEKYVSTAWVISIVRGIFISSSMLISAHLVADYFNEPDALPLIYAISVVPFIKGFINPSIARFQKNFEFYQEFWFRMLVVMIDLVVAVSVTLVIQHPIGLIFGLIAGGIAEVILSWVFIKPRPYLQLDFHIAKTIITNGRWVTLSGVMNYFANKTPDIAIGRILSSSQLGGFQLLYRLTITPIDELNEVVNRVFFPMYVNIYQQSDKVIKGFSRHIQVNTIFAMVFALLITVFSQPLVFIVLGPNWISIIPYLKYMAMLMAAIAITAPTNPLLLAFHKQKVLSVTSTIKLIMVLVSILPLIQHYRVTGAILSILIAQCVIIPIRYIESLRILRNLPNFKP